MNYKELENIVLTNTSKAMLSTYPPNHKLKVFMKLINSADEPEIKNPIISKKTLKRLKRLLDSYEGSRTNPFLDLHALVHGHTNQ